MGIYGFTLLRNGLKYDYPFQESLRSLAGICDSVYLAMGKSEDGTEAVVEKLPKMKIIPTVWDENLRESGLILSEQSNIALTKLRSEHKKGWAFHLQADELIAAHEYEQIRADFAKAEAEGCDAVCFRYLHFWHRYDQIAYEWRWYSQEIRAIRIDSKAESYGDAQSLGPCQKIYYSDAHIFHYGHVRNADAYERKKNDFHRWWHKDGELEKIISRGNKNDRREPSLPYLGPYPEAMAGRIKRHQEKKPYILFFGDASLYPTRFHRGIAAERCEWTQDISRLLQADPTTTIILQPLSLWQQLLTQFKFWERRRKRMDWREGRDWTLEFQAIMALSAKGFSVHYENI